MEDKDVTRLMCNRLADYDAKFNIVYMIITLEVSQ